MRIIGTVGLLAAAVFLSFAPPAKACDSSCPLAHRKGHLAPWEQLVEKSFGIPTGFGRVLMTEEEWAEQKMLMSSMSGKERQEHKLKMNSALLAKADELGITVPAIGKKRVFDYRKTMPIDYSPANGNQ